MRFPNINHETYYLCIDAFYLFIHLNSSSFPGKNSNNYSIIILILKLSYLENF